MFFRVLKKAPTVGKSVVGICWDASLWADGSRQSKFSFGCLEQNENPGKRLPVILIASRGVPSFPLAFSPILFPSDVLFFSPFARLAPVLPQPAPSRCLHQPPPKIKKF